MLTDAAAAAPSPLVSLPRQERRAKERRPGGGESPSPGRRSFAPPLLLVAQHDPIILWMLSAAAANHPSPVCLWTQAVLALAQGDRKKRSNPRRT